MDKTQPTTTHQNKGWLDLISIASIETEPYRSELDAEIFAARDAGLTPREFLRQFRERNLTVIHQN